VLIGIFSELDAPGGVQRASRHIAAVLTGLKPDVCFNALHGAWGEDGCAQGVLETLATIGYKELKKAGVFLVPGFAKFVVIKKPATKAREGVNPFTGEKMTFKAKAASKKVRAVALKSLKGFVN